MDGTVTDTASLNSRIDQLERERDELRKDIEQLCLQQAGPSFMAVATRLHFQRMAGLEQEIENLRKKLVAFTRDNHNLQEELTEVYRIKGHLADLHSAEVSKRAEAEKQLRFFQSCVASAFAERDKSLMEAEKAKERAEAISDNLKDLQNRIEELTVECSEERKLNGDLQIEVTKLREQNEIFREVINKFYEIRQTAVRDFVDRDIQDKCDRLLHDSPDLWSFNDLKETSSSKYITSLEKEVERSRQTIDNLQTKLMVGLEIEDHLRKRICALEERHINYEDMVRNGLLVLHNFHAQHRHEIINLFEEEKKQIALLVGEVNGKMMQTDIVPHNLEALERDEKSDDIECRDVHVNSDVDRDDAKEESQGPPSKPMVHKAVDTSDVLAQALQEKVAALLLLSQQEERHLLEKEVNVVLQKRMDELQRNLLQVTNEKVKALMELAQVRKEYQELQEGVNEGMKLEKASMNQGDKSIAAREKFKGLLKRTYLRHWMAQAEESSMYLNDESHSARKANSSVDYARLKIDNATLKESMGCMEHLTSSIHRLRLSLLKAREAATSTPIHAATELDNIIAEAKLVKTALGSSLPVSWSADTDIGAQEGHLSDPSDPSEGSAGDKVDAVSAAGFEMVELLMLAAELEKEILRGKTCTVSEQSAL